MSPIKQYDQTPQQWVFACWLLNQGQLWVWKASNMDPKHICLCGNKFYWVVWWQTYFATWFVTARHVYQAVWPDSSTMGFCLLAYKPRPEMSSEGLKHGSQTYMFMWEQVLLGGLITNLLCHCQAHLASSMTRFLSTMGFSCWHLNQGLQWVWKALYIGPKHICLCGNKFYLVSQSLTHFVTWFYTTRNI